MNDYRIREIEVVDSHTGGEPTRVVLSGWPEVMGQTMEERRSYMRDHHDFLRQAVICEPRGHDAIVGALLLPPVNAGSACGVVFFNDVGYLGMCGHAMIGAVETLRYLNRISGNSVTLDTPAGSVEAHFDREGTITIANVESYLYKKDVTVEVPGYGAVTGDVGYGGNWFFMASSFKAELSMERLEDLMRATKAMRQALAKAGITGPDGEVVDHIELYGPAENPKAHSKNFVLCPGNAYDRAPCGTGTSAKMAAMVAKGKFKPGDVWIQESITGSLYEGYVEVRDGKIFPFIKSRAHVVSHGKQVFNNTDPFCWGIPSDIATTPSS